MSEPEIKHGTTNALKRRGIRATLELQWRGKLVRRRLAALAAALGAGWRRLPSSPTMLRFVSRRGYREFAKALHFAARGERALLAACPDARVTVGAAGG